MFRYDIMINQNQEKIRKDMNDMTNNSNKKCKDNQSKPYRAHKKTSKGQMPSGHSKNATN